MEYFKEGFTATHTLEGRVQGVVVQIGMRIGHEESEMVDKRDRRGGEGEVMRNEVVKEGDV